MSVYRKRVWEALAVQSAGVVVAGAAGFALVVRARQLPLAVVLVGLTLAGVLVLVAGQPWWRRIDEMEREEHALAWYEGGLSGAVIVLLCILGIAAHSGAYRELALGAAVCFLAQGLGYLVFWAIRRSGRRDVAQ